MRTRPGGVLKVCLCALVLAGCSSSGGGPEPRRLPAALRGQTHTAVAATYRVLSTTADYTALRDPSDPTGSTTVTSASQGGSMSLRVTEVLDFGGTVEDSLELTLPRGSATQSPNLHYPAANANFSYLSFGEWMRPLSSQTTQGGFFAFGSETPGTGIPLMNSATFTGAFHAKAFEGSLVGVFTTTIDGSLTAQADFGARTVTLSTTNSVDPSYNLTGTLSYLSGVNELRGNLSTVAVVGPGSGYSGQGAARFFGPNAEEIGGAFRLTRSNPVCLFGTCPWLQDTYMGSFGARR